VLAGVVFGGRLLELTAVASALAAFGVFCGLSGAVYLFNDVADREADQKHPLKRERPIASGELAVSTAVVAGVILGGVISDRYAPARPRIRMEIQAVALLAGAPFLFLLGRAATEWAAYGALAGFGFFRGLFESNLYPAFYSVISARYHSAASGLLIAFSFLIASAAPVLLGRVKETAGLASGISALSVFYVAGALAAFAGSRRL